MKKAPAYEEVLNGYYLHQADPSESCAFVITETADRDFCRQAELLPFQALTQVFSLSLELRLKRPQAP